MKKIKKKGYLFFQVNGGLSGGLMRKEQHLFFVAVVAAAAAAAVGLIYLTITLGCLNVQGRQVYLLRF